MHRDIQNTLQWQMQPFLFRHLFVVLVYKTLYKVLKSENSGSHRGEYEGDSFLQNMVFNFQPASMFVFLVFSKNCLVKTCSSLENLWPHNISWSDVDGFKFWIHLSSSSVHSFWNGWRYGIKKCGVEVTFNGMTSAEFNINLLVVQMLLGGIETDGDSRQTEW
jgi:hypothetical protein